MDNINIIQQTIVKTLNGNIVNCLILDQMFKYNVSILFKHKLLVD
jgi:hypothetical protein